MQIDVTAVGLVDFAITGEVLTATSKQFQIRTSTGNDLSAQAGSFSHTFTAVGRHYVALIMQGVPSNYSVTATIPGGSTAAFGAAASNPAPSADPTRWEVLAAAGAAGAAGAVGAVGAAGPAGVAPATSDVVLGLPLVAVGFTATGTVLLGKGYRISKIVATKACWVKIYTSLAKRVADDSRLRTADPVGDHGLIGEWFFTAGVLSFDTLPQPFGSVASGDTYYSVTNDGASQGVTVTFTRQVLES